MTSRPDFTSAALAGLRHSHWRARPGKDRRRAALEALAEAGQRRRLLPPEPVPLPVPEAARRIHEDPRSVMPPVSRRALLALTCQTAAGGLLCAGHHEAFARLAAAAALGLSWLDSNEKLDVFGHVPAAVRPDVLWWLARQSGRRPLRRWREVAALVGGTIPAEILQALTTWLDWATLREETQADLEIAAATPRAAAEAMLAAFEAPPAGAEAARLFLRLLLTLPADSP